MHNLKSDARIMDRRSIYIVERSSNTIEIECIRLYTSLLYNDHITKLISSLKFYAILKCFLLLNR